MATEVSRTVIIPEVDAYCLSTIAGYALEGGKASGYAVSGVDKPIAALNAAFTYFANHEVPADDQIVFVSPDFMNALRNTTEVTKFLGQADYEKNKDIKFEITKYQGRDLITVSPERLRTGIVMGDEGYAWGASSLKINFLAVAKSAVMHIVKYNKVKIISGDANLASRGFDGYTIFARVYHDVFVPDNKRYAIYVNTAASGTQGAVKLDITRDDAHKVTEILTTPPERIAFAATSTAEGTVGQKLTGTITLVNVGDTLDTSSAAVIVYAIDSNKIVLDKVTLAKDS